MKKLKLNLDEIKVESFVVPESQKTNGTVNGQLLACDTNDPCGSGGGGGGVGSNLGYTCVGNTCGYASCGGTCYESCGGTCDFYCNPTYANTCPYDCNFTAGNDTVCLVTTTIITGPPTCGFTSF